MEKSIALLGAVILIAWVIVAGELAKRLFVDSAFLGIAMQICGASIGYSLAVYIAESRRQYLDRKNTKK